MNKKIIASVTSLGLLISTFALNFSNMNFKGISTSAFNSHNGGGISWY